MNAKQRLKSIEFRDGEKRAEEHIKNGRLRLEMYGDPAQWVPEYARLLAERFGVELEFCGCLAPAGPDDLYVAGYNSRMEREIKSRFGPDALKDTVDAARRNVEHTGRDRLTKQ